MNQPFEFMGSSEDRTSARSTREVREGEIRRRAMMLAGLGYTREQAEARLRANTSWEHEGLGKPVVLKKLSVLVGEAFGKAGVAPTRAAGKKKR